MNLVSLCRVFIFLCFLKFSKLALENDTIKKNVKKRISTPNIKFKTLVPVQIF